MDNILDLMNAINSFIENASPSQSIILVCIDTKSSNVAYTVNGSVDALSLAISTGRTEIKKLSREQLVAYSAVQNTILKMALEIAKEDKIVASKLKKALKQTK